MSIDIKSNVPKDIKKIHCDRCDHVKPLSYVSKVAKYLCEKCEASINDERFK